MLKRTGFLYTARLVDMLASFVQVKLFTLFLSKFVVGQIFFVIGLASFISSFFFAGFPYVFPRFVPKYGEEENYTLLNLSLLIFFLGLAITTTVGYLVYRQLNFWILYTGVYVYGVLPLISAFLIGRRKIGFLFVLTLLRAALFIALLIFFKRTLSLDILGGIFLFSGLTTFFVFWFVEGARIIYSEVIVIFREIRDYWKYSFLNQFFQPVFMYLYRIITPYIAGYEILASFTVARRIDNFSRRMFQVPLDIISPEISERDRRRDEIVPVLKEMKKFFVAISAIVFLTFVVIGKYLILLISTRAYLDAYPALLILGVGIIISSTYSIDAVYLRSIGDMRSFFVHNLLWMIVFLLTFVFLGLKIRMIGLASAYPSGHLIAGFYIKSRVADRDLLKPDKLFVPVVILSLLTLWNHLVGIILAFYTFWILLHTDFKKLLSQKL